MYEDDTIGDILSIRFVGNARDDVVGSDKLDRIDRFIARPDVSMAHKIKAERYVNEACFGMKLTESDEELAAIIRGRK